MKLGLCLALLCCASLVCSSPLRKLEFVRAAESAMSLAKKILSDIPAVHESCVQTPGLTLSGESKHLEYLLSEFDFPEEPQLTSEYLTLDTSLTRIANGLQSHLRLLQEIRDRSSSGEKLGLLLADIRDLSAQVREMQQSTQISSSGSQQPFTHQQLSGDYQVRVAAHLSLQRLRSFTQDVFRSLRRMVALGDPKD